MGLPIKYDFIKDRFDPFLETYLPNSISDEQLIIPAVSPFYIRTKEVAKQDTPSTIEIWTAAGKTGTQFTEVSSAPAQGEFQVDYKYDTGYIRFNELDASTAIYVTYQGIGDEIQAEHVNLLSDWLGKNYTKADNHNHNGTDSKLVGSAGGAAGGDLSGTYPDPSIASGAISEPKLASNTVSQTKLKSTEGEVDTGSGGNNPTLPGGQYGFWPQIKKSSTASDVWQASVFNVEGNSLAGFTSYASKINLYSASYTVYARQTYITASGRDHWIFFMVDKITGKKISGYQAPDHPCCGQGGDENDIPHPFIPMDESKYEVVLIDNEILSELKTKVTSKRSLLTVINEEYVSDMASNPIYQEREIIEIDEYGDKKGEILAKIKTPNWAKIKISADEIYLKRRLVKTLPPDIKYKKLKLK